MPLASPSSKERPHTTTTSPHTPPPSDAGGASPSLLSATTSLISNTLHTTNVASPSSSPGSACNASPQKRLRPSESPIPTSTNTTSTRRIDTKQIRNDRLGTLVRKLCESFSHHQSWESFVNAFRGPSYLSPELDNLDHPAAQLLRQWRDQGVPAECDSPPWTEAQKDECIQRGCHYSASEHADFIREEMAEFIENKFWMVLPYELVKYFEEIMFSPAAIKEERDRKPRFLCDHSWDWGWPSVNDSTLEHSPHGAMQFGRTLERLLFAIRHADPKFGPVRISKADIKDGFYRRFLRAIDCLRLAIVLPKYEGEPQLIGIPLACTMGWVQSPPSFCTMSETVCDLANKRSSSSPTLAEPHRMEPHASSRDDLSYDWTPRPREADAHAADAALGGSASPNDLEEVAPPSNRPLKRPLGSTDVFVDDFIQLGQGGKRRMLALRRHLYHAIDDILASPNVSVEQRNEALSLKKLLKGEGAWETRKVLLGWIVDAMRQTIELPAHRKLMLATIFSDLAQRNRVSRKSWERILGKLRFVSTAIPGSAGLFGALQGALTSSKSTGRVRITRVLRDHISAFHSLAADLCRRPTHLAELVPQEPTLLGTTDAAKMGMGGVYYDPHGTAYVWRAPFPLEVQARLVSSSNRAGDVTNSDLEHAGILTQLAIMASNHNVRYATLAIGADNTPAVSRMNKGSTMTQGPGPRLCHFQSAHQRQHRYCAVTKYIPGPDNIMADDASRLQHLTDQAFLAHFDQSYPQPRPWVLLQPPPETISLITSMLLCRSPNSPQLVRLDGAGLGPSPTGKLTVRNLATTPSSLPSPARTACPTSWPMATSTDSWASGRPEKPRNLFELAPWMQPSLPSARGSPTWVDQIPGKHLGLTPFYRSTETSSKDSNATTSLKPGSTRLGSPSSKPCMIGSTLTTPIMASSTAMSSNSPSLASSGSCGRANFSTPTTPSSGLKLLNSRTSP